MDQFGGSFAEDMQSRRRVLVEKIIFIMPPLSPMM